MKLAEKLGKIFGVEPYAARPMLFCAFTNCMAYYLSRIIAKDFYHHDISIAVDNMIPCTPFFWTWMYLASFVVWGINYVIYANQGENYCKKLVLSDFICKFICFSTYILFPTATEFTIVPVTDYWSFLLNFIQSIDQPNNLFPSLHCVVSWIGFRRICEMDKVSKRYKYASLMIVLLIFLSVLFTKQHLVLDIFSGVFVAEIGIHISNLVFKDKVDDKLRESAQELRSWLQHI